MHALCLMTTGGLMALSAAALAAGGAPEYLSTSRPRIDLDGRWEFRLDPEDKGTVGEWFGAKVAYPDRIRVPGNWQAQGFGEPRRHLRHDYQGKAWYRQTVRVPEDWAGQRIWLHLGGVVNTAEVYANGRHVGSVDGFLTPYEFDVTDAASPGQEAVIACCVTSTGPAPVGMFNFFGRWGGLYRSVWLEARSDPAIDDVFVMPDVGADTARVRVTIRRARPGRAWRGHLRATVAPVTGGPSNEAESLVRLAGDAVEDAVVVDVPITGMHPWSPEDPFLYHVDVSLCHGATPVDSVRDRFGMRQFSVGSGGKLLLNGKPYFVRGLGDDCVEVLSGTAEADKSVYLERIRQCKRYGFNGFRYLAHTPAKEILDAADEVGFLIMAEGEIYWKDKTNIPLLKRQVEWIARAYRNHPSWYIWSSGNEFFECQGGSPDPEWLDYIQYAHDTFKRLDPTRFFVASDGADVFPTDIITQAARFGRPPTLSDQPFSGAVDEVAYFRRALSADEMLLLSDPAGDYRGRVLRLEPAGYWPLDEIEVGPVSDVSGHGHDGQHEEAVGAANLGRPGTASGALATGPGGQAVSLTGAAAVLCATGAEPFSVSLWVKPSAFGRDDWGTPFSCGSARDGSALLLSLDGEHGDGRLVIGKWMQNVLASEARLTAGEWNHVGVTYDGVTLSLFVNGGADASVAVPMGVVPVDARIGGLIRGGLPDFSHYRNLPHIWHEFPNTYVGPLADMRIDAKYIGVFRDDGCMSRLREQIAELGLSERYAEARRRSTEQFYLYLKDWFETARRSPTLDGFAYWLMTDIPGGVEGDMNPVGIFDPLYAAEKFPDPAPILQFNSETVLLIDAGQAERVIGAGERREVALCISHFGGEPIADGVVQWELKGEGIPISRGQIDTVRLEVGAVDQVASAVLGPWLPQQPAKVTLTARLKSAACEQSNEWDFWIFPARKRDFARAGIVNRSGLAALTARYAASEGGLDGASLVVTQRLTPDIRSYVAAGGTAVLLAERGGLTRPLSFTYWPAWIRRIGNYIEDHPALRGFPNDGFCAFQFVRLFGSGLDAVDLTEPRTPERQKLAPIVWGLKADYDPSQGLPWSHPDNRWKHYRAGLVCEGRIGEGRVVVCVLHVLEGIEAGWPEAGHLLDCLVGYALSDEFAPATEPMSDDEAAAAFTG